ncbi:MAG: hypothetical protein ACO1N8_07580 [Methylophilus sp.]
MRIADLWSWLSSNATNVIALSALVATFWQAYITRKHNKLSVKPYLTTWTTTSSDGYIIVKIINNGTGPAHIKSFNIFADNQKMIGESLEPHIKCLNLIFPEYQFIWYGSYFGIDYMMPATEQKDLIAIKFTGEKVPNRNEIDHRAKRVKIVIDYESIYEEKFKYDSDNEVKKQNN